MYQAERKLRTSTHIPDLDNANVGMYDVDFREMHLVGISLFCCYVT